MTNEYSAKQLEIEVQPVVPMNAERQPIVTVKDGEVFANSRDVASFFGKNHRDVMRAIDTLIAQAPDLPLRTFAQGVYVLPETGEQEHRCFDMTRDGFTLLAMGFTGAKALKWKLKYIEAFNVMEARLRQPALPDFSDPKILLGAFQHLQEQVAVKDAQLAQQGQRLVKLDRIEAADGSLCFTDAAKTLKVRPKDLISMLQAHDWIYRRVGGPLIGYQAKVQAGFLEHTEYRTTDGNGNERVHVQCRITAKGLVKAAELISALKH